MDSQSFDLSRAFDFEEGLKKARRHRLIILIAIFLVVGILCSVFLFAACRYNQTPFSKVNEDTVSYDVADGFLFPRGSADYCASYNLNTGVLNRYPKKSIDLANYGLSGTYTYFFYQTAETENAPKGRIVEANADKVALSRANTDRSFLAVEESGAKYVVDLDLGTAVGLFEGETLATDPLAHDVTEFSHNGGLCAVGHNGLTLNLYVRKDTSSFALDEVYHLDLSDTYDTFSYYFCSDTYVQVIGQNADGETLYSLVNAKDGSIKPSPRPEGVQYEDRVISTAYSRSFLAQSAPEHMEGKKWDTSVINLTLGTPSEYRFASDILDARFEKVSPSGAYALVNLTLADENGTEFERLYLSKSEGKTHNFQAFLNETLDEDATGQDVIFLADTVLLVNTRTEDGKCGSIIVKICF